MAKSKPDTAARSRFNVDVTEEDIARAIRNDSYTCVVAQAVARTIPDATRIEVDTQTIRFSAAGERWVFLTPYAVQGYVIAFDAGEEIESFSFQLRDPKRTAARRSAPAGAKAKNAARRAALKVEREAASQDAPETKDEARAAARAAYAEAREEYPGRTEETTGRPRQAPRVFKRKRRSYGHRLLRINQENGAP